MFSLFNIFKKKPAKPKLHKFLRLRESVSVTGGLRTSTSVICANCNYKVYIEQRTNDRFIQTKDHKDTYSEEPIDYGTIKIWYNKGYQEMMKRNQFCKNTN